MPPIAAPAGVATGVGSLPGDDVDSCLAMVFDELPDLPHLPELPARGPGADIIGRTAGQLVDLPVDRQPAGWRLVARPGGDRQRARDLLARDLDALVPVAGPGYDGRLKLQLAGPWTLAANVELPRGGPALGDRGAVGDIAASLAAAVGEHLAEVRRRVPTAELVLQLDEPSLPAVLAGRVPTASGFGRVRAVEPVDAQAQLAAVVAAAGELPVVVHCCGTPVPLRLFADVGASAVSLPLPAGVRLEEDACGELVEAGVGLWLGVVSDADAVDAPPPQELAGRVRRLWRDLGFPPELSVERVVLTPACGLPGTTMQQAQAVYRTLREASRSLVEAPEGLAR